uniref:Uncharacterized protein n=1 Tax=Utricularia reniformis TaxID=192314 RepID=A0A1Y0B108_9LAMI|nr:hypothetical protein AEK19_MT0906 [Utricularia reniformis]ART31135.1 hypothetical protein AEK19_MT0906 [Utricularia reniformis]
MLLQKYSLPCFAMHSIRMRWDSKNFIPPAPILFHCPTADTYHEDSSHIEWSDEKLLFIEGPLSGSLSPSHAIYSYGSLSCVCPISSHDNLALE